MGTPFPECVNYDLLFGNLAARGILFDEQEKKRFQEICDRQLRHYDGNSAGSLTHIVTESLYSFFLFLQKLTSGNLNFDNIGTSLGTMLDQTSEQSNLKSLQDATAAIWIEFGQAGGKFKLARELVTGQTMTSNVSGPEYMQGNIYEQIRQTINLPAGTSTGLNRGS